MAEFVEVMKKQVEMCKSFGICAMTMHPCCGLSAENNGKHLPCHTFVTMYPAEAEKIIMEWAKENK